MVPNGAIFCTSGIVSIPKYFQPRRRFSPDSRSSINNDKSRLLNQIICWVSKIKSGCLVLNIVPSPACILDPGGPGPHPYGASARGHTPDGVAYQCSNWCGPQAFLGANSFLPHPPTPSNSVVSSQRVNEGLTKSPRGHSGSACQIDFLGRPRSALSAVSNSEVSRSLHS